MEKELEKVKGALDDFRKKLVDVVKKGKDEADRVTKAAQVKIEIGSLKRQKRDLFEELGDAFYGSYKKPGKKDEAVIAELVSSVKEIDKRIGALNRQLKAGASEKGSAPKRRGRPPKAGAGTRAAKASAPKRRGRPPKAASGGGSKAAAPRRRGRPPKAAPRTETPAGK